MSVLNRPLFRRPSAMPPIRGPMPVVNREKGSPEKGEENIATKLMEALSKMIGKAEPSTGSQKESDINFYRDKGYSDSEISLIFNGVLNPMEFDPGVFSLNFDMEAAVNEGKLIRRGDPNSAVREGEGFQYDIEVDGKNKSFNFNEPLTDQGMQQFREKYGISALREGEIPGFAMGGETNGLEELSRMRFRQQGSPMMGEQVDAGNVGILDGFSEQQASAMVQEGEQSRAQIDGAQDYDELMKSTRGDNASEEERRDELAQLVGEEDAQQTPDSVLALIQPVMQMLETEAAETGIAQVEGQNMPPEMMGTGIAQFAEGGAVLKIPKYSNGTDSFGVSNQPNIEQSNQSDDTDQYPETANFLLNMADDIIGNSLGTKNQAIMDKYEDNYKLFSEILGGQGPSKDQMIGDILTTVVSPLAFAFAQGADLKDILPQGTAAIGKIAKNYDALSSKQESQIKNLALTEAMKVAEDPLMQVYLRDDPETPDVNESLQKVFRKESEVLSNPSLYTAESIADLEAKIAKMEAETDKLKTETAISEVELKYADIMADKEIKHKDSLIDSVKINNAINEVVLEFKPETLTAELNKINLTNIEQGIRNDTLRPKLEAELETTLVQLDIAEENLKQEIITTTYADQLKGLEGDMLQAEIDKLEQEHDFNTDNNYLLLKEKEAQIKNLKLTGEQIDLENEYKVLENKFAEEEFSLENEALLLDNINKRLENSKLSIENAFITTEKKLGIDKIKLDMELLNENISGQMLQNEKTLLDLNNYDEKTFLEFQKQKREIEKLEYELANPTKDWSEIKVQAEMRNKWNLSPMTVNMRDKQGFMQNLVSNAGENTGAGDLSFIFQYMKMLDPRSVVREGEFETAKRTGGIPASVWAAYEGIKNGRLLSAQVKADFLSAASKMYIQELENYNAELDTYRGIASANGLDPELTIPSMNLDQELIKQLTNVNTINDSLSIINNFDLQDSVLPNVSDGRIKIPNLINK
jgi:hypothetical protein